MKTTISIPTPCSEDWSKMTPTDKGAFCGKCQFEVVDFTGKEPEQIKQILKERSGSKTCGHISPVQMELVNTNYHIWENQPFKVFRSKFLYACLMVFGMALFTGCQTGNENDIQGDMQQVEENGMMEEDTTCGGDTLKSCDTPDTGMVVDGEMEFLEGELEFEDGEIEVVDE